MGLMVLMGSRGGNRGAHETSEISRDFSSNSSPFYTASPAVVYQFSADGESHRAKHLCLHVCNSHRKPALQFLKRRDGTRHVDDVSVSPVNLNPRTVYNHMYAVIMCSD